jgi:hypothetical protein
LSSAQQSFNLELDSDLVMWRLGFAFHEMASGLLSVFLPLYIVAIDGANALLDIGIMSAVAMLLAIPALIMNKCVNVYS